MSHATARRQAQESVATLVLSEHELQHVELQDAIKLRCGMTEDADDVRVLVQLLARRDEKQRSIDVLRLREMEDAS